MHIAQVNVDGNPNIGLLAYVNDKFGLVGAEVPQKTVELLEKVMKVPFHNMSVAGTPFVGAFITGTEDLLLVPSVLFDYEKQRLDELGIKYQIIDTKLTALGNNIAINKQGALINPEFEQEVKTQLAQITTIREQCIVDHNTVGSCLVLTSRGGVIHRDTLDQQIDELSEFFGVPIEIGTVNQGSLQVASGLVANTHGFAIGDLSTGIEASNVDEILYHE